MTMTVHFGWWLIPAIATLATLAYALWPQQRSYGYFGADFAGVLVLMACIIGDLWLWLIWALVA